MAFLPLKMEGPIEYCYIKCLPAQVKAVEEYAFQVLREALPYTLSPQISTLQQDLEEIQGLESKMKNIILFFAIVSVIITLLGVYSAITLDTEHRCKEVAIRKVNGAGLRQILYLFLRMYVRILIITAVIAFPLLYTILQLWKQMYIVFFNDGLCFWICIFIGIVLITLLTVIFQHFENCKNKSGGYNKDRVSIESMCEYALFLCTIAHQYPITKISISLINRTLHTWHKF